jgi:hypothetical protein
MSHNPRQRNKFTVTAAPGKRAGMQKALFQALSMDFKAGRRALW